MATEEEIGIKNTFRVDKGNTKTILIELWNARDKRKIFKSVGNSKDKIVSKDRKLLETPDTTQQESEIDGTAKNLS